MKTTFKVLGLVFGLGTVILLTFHLVLLYGMTKAMREVVLPQVKAETGFDVRVGGLSINVAAGKMYLTDLEIRNPEGFLLKNMASVERVMLEVDVISLLDKNPYRIHRVEVGNALVNVIRNQDGAINLNSFHKMTKRTVDSEPPRPTQPEVEPPTDRGPVPEKPAPADKVAQIPEMIFEALEAEATVRYIDLKLNEVDLALDLEVRALGISTLRDENTPWGKAGIKGAVGSERTHFMTDLKLTLAPVTNPQELSFDLVGKILEIDPRVMGKVYDKLNVRSDPFGIDPVLHARFGRFQQSNLGLNIRNVRVNDSLSRKLGGMAAVELLRIDVPVKGTVQQPVVDTEAALKSAIGNNIGSILDSFLKGAAKKETDKDVPPETLSEAAVDVLGEHVEEIGDNEAAKKVLKDLADGEPSATNAPATISSDTIVDILGEEIDEIGENEALKDDLKSLGKWLFGQ